MRSHLRQMPTALPSGMIVMARFVSTNAGKPPQLLMFGCNTSTGALHGPHGPASEKIMNVLRFLGAYEERSRSSGGFAELFEQSTVGYPFGFRTVA